MPPAARILRRASEADAGAGGSAARLPRARRRRDLTARLHRSYSFFFALRQWFRRHVTPAGALFFWVMLAAGSLTDTSRSMTHQLFGLLFCALATGLIFVRKPGSAFELERILPRQASVGAPFSYRIRIRNLTGRARRGLELREGLPDPRPSLEEFSALAEPGEERRNWFDRRYRFYRWTWLCNRNTRARIAPIPLPLIPPGSHVELLAELVPLRRGRLVLSNAEIARTDPFGLFRRLDAIRGRAASVLVLPRLLPLPDIELPGRSQRLQSGGVAMAGAVGDSEEFVAVRDYRPGDPLRRIHWAGWARAQRPVVKEFQEEFFVRHALVLDTFGGGPESDAFEGAVSIAASFASTVDQRDSLLDLMFVGDRAFTFTAGRGLAHAEQMLEILAGVDLHAAGRFESLEATVLKHCGAVSGCILVLLAWDEPRRRLRERLAARSVPTLTFVVHHAPPPESADLPPDVHWIRSDHVAGDFAATAAGRGTS